MSKFPKRFCNTLQNVEGKMTKNRVEVAELPECDYCKLSSTIKHLAHYDAKTKSGKWAYLCPIHFQLYGIGLGLGIGQELVLPGNPES